MYTILNVETKARIMLIEFHGLGRLKDAYQLLKPLGYCLKTKEGAAVNDTLLESLESLSYFHETVYCFPGETASQR